jgi:hypothetical protein
MIITNALVACCEVVIDRKSTSGPRGLVYLMISWEPIPTKENIYKVTPYGLGTNSINQPMPVVLFPCIILNGKWDHLEKAIVPDIGVVMSKSRKKGWSSTHQWCCGIGLRCLGLGYLVGVVEEV